MDLQKLLSILGRTVLRSLWRRIWRVRWLTDFLPNTNVSFSINSHELVVPATIAFAQFSVSDEYGLVKIVSLRDPWRIWRKTWL